MEEMCGDVNSLFQKLNLVEMLWKSDSSLLIWVVLKKPVEDPNVSSSSFFVSQIKNHNALNQSAVSMTL